MKYIVPEYYEHFKCKCGECRHSCCDGWPIRISMKEYYHLLGIKCSDKLRVKLDCALKFSLESGNEHYAQISTDWRGICMLHREDGLCSLQTELGESSLPAVCRLYPRSTKRLSDLYMCTCSNSCEEVIGLLMNLQDPLLLEEKEAFIIPEFEINFPPQKYECYKKSVSIIRERELSLPERFIKLGNFLCGTDLYSKKPDNLSLALQILHGFDRYFECSDSIGDYCKLSLKYFGMEDREKLSAKDMIIISDKYTIASKHLETLLPEWQILFENLILNHMIYINFPYNTNPEDMKDAFLSLAFVYSFLRFNILGFMSDKINSEKLVDFLSTMFRLIEHSNFNYLTINLFQKENFPVQASILQLLYV